MPQFRLMLPVLIALTAPQIAVAKESTPSVRLEVTSRTPAFGGQSFGEYGSYERITGKAHMRIDPRAPANRGIVDLALAPRAKDGMVEYDVDFVIERPADPAKARKVLFYEVVNRGMRLMSMMSGAGMNPENPGDGLLQRQGLTLVASGWQGDITAKSLVGARFPVASRGGKSVTGPVSTETIFDNLTGNRITLPYAAATLNQGNRARLWVRDLSSDRPVLLPANSWRFIDDRKVEIQRPEGFGAGAIYQFEYNAKDPKVMGLGFAATRDLIAFLRQGSAAQGNPLADIGTYQSAVAFGGSQSGRYLRDFLWQGFNRDLSGGRVFDGAIPFIPGGRRTFTNLRFAEPGRFSRQHEDHDVPGFGFPFAYATLTDKVTGKTDGILKSCSATATCPKIFHIDTSAEFWQAGAYLVGTGGTDRDVPLPEGVRAYMIAGGAHAPGMMLPACRYPANALNYTPVVRAMLVAMVDWTTKGKEPPANRWPSLAKGELVALSALKPPQVPSADLVWPSVMNRPIPPAGKGDWPAYVPQIDADGNDLAGIRLPQVAAAQGTYLGWNLRKAGYGEGDLCLLAGSYLPFALDAAARSGDTRASLTERYPTAGDMTTKFNAAIDGLRSQRLLLDEDAQRMAITEAKP
jgi:hypothetical protein